MANTFEEAFTEILKEAFENEENISDSIELAHRIGISPQLITDLEQGNISKPKIPILKKLSLALGQHQNFLAEVWCFYKGDESLFVQESFASHHDPLQFKKFRLFLDAVLGDYFGSRAKLKTKFSDFNDFVKYVANKSNLDRPDIIYDLCQSNPKVIRKAEDSKLEYSFIIIKVLMEMAKALELEKGLFLDAWAYFEEIEAKRDKKNISKVATRDFSISKNIQIDNIPVLNANENDISTLFEEGHDDTGDWIVNPDPKNIKDTKACAFRIDDNAMSPKFLIGDLVIAEPSLSPINGKACIYKPKDRPVSCRIYKIRDTFVDLIPLNPSDDIISMTREELKFIYLISGMYRRLE